jgi:zona occludens toxin (predicted ATPase)
VKPLKSLVGMNETASILLLLIISVWFFTNGRFQALLAIIKAPMAAAGSNEAPITQAQLDANTKAPASATNPKAGVVPVSPTGGVPGITQPIIDPALMG